MLKLSDIGVGYPLFFYLKQYFIMMFFFIFFFVGLWTLIVNILPNNGKEWVDDNQASIFTQMSLGNHGVAKENYDKLEVTLQPVFHLIVIFLLLLFCIYIRIKIFTFIVY